MFEPELELEAGGVDVDDEDGGDDASGEDFSVASDTVIDR